MIARKHYINGRPVYYECRECGSKDMKHEPHTSVSSGGQMYICMTCGSVELNPQQLDAIAGCYDLRYANSEDWLSAMDLAKVITFEPGQFN